MTKKQTKAKQKLFFKELAALLLKHGAQIHGSHYSSAALVILHGEMIEFCGEGKAWTGNRMSALEISARPLIKLEPIVRGEVKK